MRRFFAVCSITGVAGCGVIPDFQSDPQLIAPPRNWTAAFKPSSDAPPPWLEEMADPRLTALIDEALRHNADLKAAAARVAAYRALARIDNAGRFPQLSAELKGSRTQRNSTSGFRISNPRTNSFGVDFSLNWELDVWGKLQNRAAAAQLSIAASEQDYRAARLSLAAGVASAWYRTLEAEQQLQLAEHKVKTFIATRDIIDDGYITGLYSALDLRLARANQAEAENQRAARRIVTDNSVRRLEILLGRYPGAGIMAGKTFPQIKTTVAAGFPGSLLRRRPDIVAAEMRLLAADQRLTAAWKNLLPTFSFAASGGTNAGQLRDILNYDALVWNIIGNLTQPVFQGGRLIAEADQVDAKTLEAAADYANTVLQAYYEVETALNAEQQLRTQQLALRRAVDEAAGAERLALDEYRSGLVDLITLLEAQRRV